MNSKNERVVTYFAGTLTGSSISNKYVSRSSLVSNSADIVKTSDVRCHKWPITASSHSLGALSEVFLYCLSCVNGTAWGGGSLTLLGIPDRWFALLFHLSYTVGAGATAELLIVYTR